MINSAEAKEFNPSTEGPCRHHWILDPPKDSVSKGICKNCGEERTYPNELPIKSDISFGTITNLKLKTAPVSAEPLSNNPPVLD